MKAEELNYLFQGEESRESGKDSVLVKMERGMRAEAR